MKWLIYGSYGWIGSQVIELLKKNSNNIIIQSNLRVDNSIEIEKEILETLPDRIICLIGRTTGPGFTTIDYLEQKGKLIENINDNLFSPMVLAILSNKYNIHLTYLGTGCIFSYNDNKYSDNGFKEEDNPNFFGSEYSIIKGYTDRLFNLMDFKGVLNVRIRMPIVGYDHPKNFITKICSYEKVVNIPNSMTVLPELLPIMIDMSINQASGTINLTNPGRISHNEILDMYKEIIDPEFTYKNFTEEEQNKILLSKRSNNLLDTYKLEKLYPNVKNIKDSIRELFLNWKKDNLHFQ